MANLYIASQYIHSDQNTTGVYFSTIIKHFQNLYPLLDVIDSEPLFTFGLKEEAYFSNTSTKNKLTTRIFSQIMIAFRMLIKIIRRLRKGDVLVTGTNPTFLLPLIAILVKVIRFKWCLILHDVFPDNALAARILKEKSILYRIIDYVFTWTYRSSDKLIVIGRDMTDIASKKGVADENIILIPNWASPEEVIHTTKNESSLIKNLKWEDKIVFQFFGNIGRLQGIEYILDAIALTKNTNLAFLFIGGGAAVDNVKNFIANNSDRTVHYHGPLPLEMKNIGLASCDVALVSLESGMTGLGVPSKSYFSMAADRPILAIMDKDAEISRVVLEEGIGWHTGTQDAAALALLMDSISNDDILALKGKPRKVLIEKYSEECAMHKYVDCITQLLDIAES